LHKAAQDQIQKASEYKKLLAVVNARKANKWQGPPSIHFETEFVRKEKVNEDVGPGKLKINFETSKQMAESGALYIKYSLKVTDQCNIKGHFEIDKNQEVVASMPDKLSVKVLDKKEMVLKLKRRKMIFKKETVD